MNQIWAPWRLEYVGKNKKNRCVFCKILKENAEKDSKNLIIKRFQHCFAVLNKFPYNNGHMMVVPNRHIAQLDHLTNKETTDLHQATLIILKILKKTLKPHGFNIGINLGKFAGAGIEKHLHTHIVPRWCGDTNFMPIISNTKVIPQSLEMLYNQLIKCLHEKK